MDKHVVDEESIYYDADLDLLETLPVISDITAKEFPLKEIEPTDLSTPGK